MNAKICDYAIESDCNCDAHADAENDSSTTVKTEAVACIHNGVCMDQFGDATRLELPTPQNTVFEYEDFVPPLSIHPNNLNLGLPALAQPPLIKESIEHIMSLKNAASKVNLFIF